MKFELVNAKNQIRRNYENCFFLGAGASHSDGAPVQSELFKSYFEARKDPKYADKHKYVKCDILEITSHFFQTFFNVKDDKPYPSFEEALGVIQLGREYYTDGVDYHAALILAMEEAIKYKLDYCKYKEKDRSNFHSKLAEKLNEKSLINNISFISSNYDLLIDNAFNYNPDIDYGLSKDIKEENKWKIYKLHGSLNWLYCPKCKTTQIFSESKEILKQHFASSKQSCNKCRTILEPIIVPPSYFKPELNNESLKNVWRNAKKVLIEAEHIIFCGYSFPDADINIKYLIKSAELDNESKLKKVTLVNHYGTKRDEIEYINVKKEEIKRFKRFFKCEVIDSGKSFEEFVKTIDENLD